MDPNWLASKLREGAIVDEAAIAAALGRGDDLCLELLRAGAVEESTLLRFLGLQLQTRYITTDKLGQAAIPQWVLDLVPVELCEKLRTVPVRCDKQRTVLIIVTPSPSDSDVKQSLQQLTGVQKVQAHLALPHAIDAAIKKLYKGDLHAFAKIDRLLAQNYNEMLEVYDGRLIDFDANQDALELDRSAAGPARAPAITGPAHPAVATPRPAAPATPAAPAATAEPARAPAPAAKPTPAIEPPSSAARVSAPQVQPSVEALVGLMEIGHGWRRRHSSQVTEVATAVGARLGMNETDLEQLRLAAALHEVGKPVEPHLTVLEIEDSPRARALASQVWQAPLKLLARANLPGGTRAMLAALYERLEGNGVPGRLRGEQIPLGARVLAAVDLHCDLVNNPKHGDAGLDRLPGALLALFDERSAPAVHEHLVAATSQAKRQRILIIDGDAEAAQPLELDLLGAGYDVQAMRTTAEAARALLGHQVDLIIAEIDLRPVDGFDFLQRIRSDSRTQGIPLLFLSSRNDAGDAQRSRELGAVDFLTKPYDSEALLACVGSALGR